MSWVGKDYYLEMFNPDRFDMKLVMVVNNVRYDDSRGRF